MLCRDVITRSLRKLNAVALGSRLDAAEAANALAVLQALYQEMIGWGAFGRLCDVVVTADCTAFEQMRAACRADTITVTLPSEVSLAWEPPYGGVGIYPYADGFDAAAWWGPGIPPNGTEGVRPPIDGSMIEVVKLSSTHSYVFDGQVQAWIDLTGLTLDTSAPLTGRYAEAIASMLAGRLATEYGSDVSPALQLAVRNATTLLSHRYDRQPKAAVGSFF